MADEVRRSGRANKGHHTKNADALDEPIPKPKPKAKSDKQAHTPSGAGSDTSRRQSVQPAENHEEQGEGEEEDAIYRCVCGDQREIRGREMIMCDRCMAWQHNKCLGLPDSKYWEDKTYLCEQCKPEDHAELLAAMARGEKPWNRKKGSKAPRPKFRPSDVGSEAASEREPDTPQAAQPQHPETYGQTPIAAHAASPTTAAPAPTPAPAQQSPREAPGHFSIKPNKKITTRTQPKSPVAEKRSHDAIADKEAASVKRRKSSVHHYAGDKPPPQNAPAASPEQLPEKQRLLVEALVTSLTDIIKAASESRGYRIPDGDTPSSISTRLALQIDYAAVNHHGPPTDNSSKYTLQFRSIIFNTKKNQSLVDHLLDGSLSPGAIATMPPADMASEDKRREYAAINEANEKQMILTDEPGPRLRKTHKGEEIVEEDNMVVEQEPRPPEPRIRESIDEGNQASPQRRESDVAVELPEVVSRSAPLSVDTSAPPPNPGVLRRSSNTFDINLVFEKVRSPQVDQQGFVHRRQTSMRAQQTPQEGPVVDEDIDRLLKDEDNDVEMSGTSRDPDIVWKGSIEMQSTPAFEAVGRFVAGGDFGRLIPWPQLIPSEVPIVGRIEGKKGNDYIEGFAMTGSHDVAVLSIIPLKPEGQRSFDQIYNYFHPRGRWGVVPTDKLPHEVARDLYVIPVEPGGSELPGFLNMLEYCTIETPRPTPMILLTLIAKLPDTAENFPQGWQPGAMAPDIALQRAGGVQNGSVGANAASPSLAGNPNANPNPHGPMYSPVQPGFPHTAPFPPPPSTGSATPVSHQSLYTPAQPATHSPYQPAPPASQPPQTQNQNPQPANINPLIQTTLGPFLHSPVVQQLLTMTDNWGPLQLRNLRLIMEKVPEARTDMGVLTRELFREEEGEGGGEKGVKREVVG